MPLTPGQQEVPFDEQTLNLLKEDLLNLRRTILNALR